MLMDILSTYQMPKKKKEKVAIDNKNKKKNKNKISNHVGVKEITHVKLPKGNWKKSVMSWEHNKDIEGEVF